jgi:hypothetical protein
VRHEDLKHAISKVIFKKEFNRLFFKVLIWLNLYVSLFIGVFISLFVLYGRLSKQMICLLFLSWHCLICQTYFFISILWLHYLCEYIIIYYLVVRFDTLLAFLYMKLLCLYYS